MMTRQQAGRLGGLRTVERHGREHMARIGALGFAGLARSLGYAGGGRHGALIQLTRSGKLARPADLTPGELRDLERAVGLASDDPLPY
jgi:hypothetical protein